MQPAPKSCSPHQAPDAYYQRCPDRRRRNSKAFQENIKAHVSDCSRVVVPREPTNNSGQPTQINNKLNKTYKQTTNTINKARFQADPAVLLRRARAAVDVMVAAGGADPETHVYDIT